MIMTLPNSKRQGDFCMTSRGLFDLITNQRDKPQLIHRWVFYMNFIELNNTNINIGRIEKLRIQDLNHTVYDPIILTYSSYVSGRTYRVEGGNFSFLYSSNAPYIFMTK